MAKNKNLRKNVSNQIIEAINMGHIESPLPSQSTLAELFGVSRTTIRFAVDGLIVKGLLTNTNGIYTINRAPNEEDFFIQNALNQQGNIDSFERFFNDAIKTRKIVPGQKFTELELSKLSHCPTHIVREFLLRFSRFHLVNNIDRGRWEMRKFEKRYAENLSELREMIECHALSRFMNLPKSDIRWKEAQYLLHEHRELREKVVHDYQEFSDLDHRLHKLILSAANNSFMEEFHDIISIIFHYHYQWDNSDLRKRNMVAIEEHMSILSKILSFDDIGAMGEYRRHLNTSKLTMAHSLITGTTPDA